MGGININKKKRLLTVDQKINRRHFISFTTFFAAFGGSIAAWSWLYNSPEEKAGITAGITKPLRAALNENEIIFRKISDNNSLVKTYSKDRAAKVVRVNSNIGMDEEDFDIYTWKLVVHKINGQELKINIDEIKTLPKTEIIFDFKCVEGWDQIQYWGGVKFIDFINHFKLENEAELPYVGLETPSGEYYVGLEKESALHPQTLLAYEMNGSSISVEHGAPLRLIIPVKYGIKNLKRIGSISFSKDRPRDYWSERGYDYYSGL